MQFKICFVLPEYSRVTPTHFNYIYELVKEVSKDFDVFLVAEKGNGCPDFIAKEKFYLQRFGFLPLRAIENFLLSVWLRSKGYKDFYVHYSFLSAFNVSLTVKILGGRIFYWNCGLPWLYRRSLGRGKFERLVYHLMTFLVTGTEGLKEEYARHYHLPLAKIRVLPNWIDVSRFQSQIIGSDELRSRLNISNAEKVVLFTHRLSKRKGAHYLPEIVQRLKNESIVLLIIGGGAERENIELKIKGLGLAEKVRFLNDVPNNKIQNYFKIADLFILPSEEEGFPHVLLEAMAAGLPLVAFNAGGVKDIVPPEFLKYVVAKSNLPAFAEKVRELLYVDSKKMEDLKRAELNWIKQFDIKPAVERFKQLLSA